MGDTASDPVDHHRTTQPLAGETMKNTAKTPGLILVAVAVVAFVVCLASFAMKQVGVGIGATIVTLLAAGASLAWLAMESRRVRQVQREWSSTHHGAVK
jgi:Flp pilus assembly protein TadB